MEEYKIFQSSLSRLVLRAHLNELRALAVVLDEADVYRSLPRLTEFLESPSLYLKKFALTVNDALRTTNDGRKSGSAEYGISIILRSLRHQLNNIEVLEVLDQPTRRTYLPRFDLDASKTFGSYLFKFTILKELHLSGLSFSTEGLIFLSHALEVVSSLSTLALMTIYDIKLLRADNERSWISLLTNVFSKCNNLLSVSFVFKDPWPLGYELVLFSLGKLMLLAKLNLALTIEVLLRTGFAARFLLGALDKRYHVHRRHHVIYRCSYFNDIQGRFLEDHLSFDIRNDD